MVKKSIITGFILILLYFVSSVALAFFGIPSPIWSDTNCGGIDPYFNPQCHSVGRGYKQQCRLFVCTKEKVPWGLPVESTEEPQPDDDDEEINVRLTPTTHFDENEL